jgi:hypothetical protein
MLKQQLLFSDGICVTEMASKQPSLSFSGLSKRELKLRSEGVARRTTIYLGGRIKAIPLGLRSSIPDSGGREGHRRRSAGA